MLNIKDCVKIEKRKQIGGTYNIYLFKCIKCDSLIKSRKCYFIKHSGECKKCSAQRTIKIAIETCRLRPFEAKFNIFKQKCPETNLSFLDYLEFTKIKNCDYCEDIIPWKEYDHNTNGFWLDRKDNNLGHIKGNLTVCCALCNFTKRNEFSYKEFKLIGKVIKQIRENRAL